MIVNAFCIIVNLIWITVLSALIFWAVAMFVWAYPASPGILALVLVYGLAWLGINWVRYT